MQIEGDTIKEYEMHFPYECKIRVNQEQEYPLTDNPQVSKRRKDNPYSIKKFLKSRAPFQEVQITVLLYKDIYGNIDQSKFVAGVFKVTNVADPLSILKDVNVLHTLNPFQAIKVLQRSHEANFIEAETFTIQC